MRRIITIYLTIETNGKYCALNCPYLHSGSGMGSESYGCKLIEIPWEKLLDKGERLPLRSDDCLRKTDEQ